MSVVEQQTKPLVSVVIPTYRRSLDYLRRAVESVRKQTYENLEIIVVDDSTEAFADRLKTEEYFDAVADARIRYYQNKQNCGASKSRNFGISCAQGQYISFLDDDDEYLPQKIESQVRFMEAGEYDISLTAMAIYSVDGKMVDYRTHRDLSGMSQDELFRYHLMYHLTGTPTFMFRADKLRQIGGFKDIRIGEEFYLMAAAIDANMKVGFSPECFVKVYQHSGKKLSVGDMKIEGENLLFSYKKSFFPQLSAAEKRHIRFRHYAVLVIAYVRDRQFVHALWAGIRAFFVAPIVFMKEVFGFVQTIFSQRKKMSKNSRPQQ